MRKRILSAWAVALLLGQVSLVHAQENEESHFWASAQIRTRGEYRNGALSPRGEGDKPAGFINERARLTLGYERKKLSLKFSAQHVGVWGQDAIIRKSKFPQNPKRSVRFSGKRTKRSVQKRKARNTQKAETKVL